MDTKMRCPNCGKGVKVPAAHIGRRGRCPHCQAAIVLQALPEQGELPVAQMIVEPQPSNEPLIAAFHEHTAALREWTAQMGSIGATVARQLSEGLEEAQKRVADSHQRQAEETRTLRAEGVREHQDLLEQIKSLQDSQVQRWGDLARSFTDMVTLAQDQFALLRQGQLESAQDVVAAMARDLQAAQEQLLTGSQERAQAQADALEQVVGRAGEAIAGINKQVAGLPGQLAAALEACSSSLHNRAESAASEAAQAFGKQTAALAELRTALQEDVRKFTQQVAEVRAGQSKLLNEATEAARQSALQVQQQIAASQQQAAGRLDIIAATIAERMQASVQQMGDLQQSFDATAAKAMEQLEAVRQGSDKAGEDRRGRLSAEAEKMLTEVYIRSEQVLRQSWQMGTHAASQQEAKLSALAERIISSLAQSQQAMARPLATLGELVQKLAPFEQSLTRSWQTLTATDAFRRTLTSIDQSLAQLNQALQSPAGPAAERLSAGVLEGSQADVET